MVQSWVCEELKTVNLRDKRLDRRLVTLLNTLSKASDASIPTACSDRAEMVAAYRFFDNDHVDFVSVLAPHIEASYQRIARQKVALLVQDTTEVDLTRPAGQPGRGCRAASERTSMRRSSASASCFHD